MATQPKKMNIIKQVLTGHKNGLSVRKMAEMFSMSPTTVQRYLKMADEDSLGINALLQLEDPELNHRFMHEVSISHFLTNCPHVITSLMAILSSSQDLQVQARAG